MNKKNTARIALAAVLASGLVSLTATAADQLNAAQLKDMFNDKTVSAVTADNKPQTTYFSPDGKIIQKTPTGEKKQGTWSVNDKGQQCITWSGAAEVCSTVVARGDGTYQRMVGDKATVTIQKMRQGNLLDE
jgi:hypothetical protein